MSLERPSGPETPTDPLSLRAQKLLPESDEEFLDFYESFAKFHTEMEAEIASFFPNEKYAWEGVPAWHVLGKSGIRADLLPKISDEVREFIEAKISHFLDVLESKSDSAEHS